MSEVQGFIRHLPNMHINLAVPLVSRRLHPHVHGGRPTCYPRLHGMDLPLRRVIAVDIRQRCPVPLLLLVDPGHCPPPGVVGPPCFRLMALGVVLDPFWSSGASSACVCHEARILFASLTPWQASCFGGSPPTKQLRRDLNAETKNYFS